MRFLRHTQEYPRFRGGYMPLEKPSMAAWLELRQIRSRMGAYETRPGTAEFGDQFDTNAVTSLLAARFSSATAILRGTAGSLSRYRSGDDDFLSVLPAGYDTWPTDESYVWRGVMAFGTFYLSQWRLFYQSGSASTEGVATLSSATGTLSAVSNSPGARDLVSCGGRLWALGTQDWSDGTFYPYRVRYTDALNLSDWATDGGYEDLPAQGGQIQRGVVQGNRIYILRGDANEGSMSVATLTESAISPVAFSHRFDTGILGAETLVRTSAGQAFFLGHDNVYRLLNGSVEPVGSAIWNDLRTRIDLTYYYKAFAYYIPQTGDMLLGIPTGETTWVQYVYNVHTQEWTAPESTTARCAVSADLAEGDDWYSIPESYDWYDVPESGADWDDIASSVKRPKILLGYNSGQVAEITEGAVTELGSAVTPVWRSGTMNFVGEPTYKRGTRVPIYITPEDHMGIDTVILRFRTAEQPTATLNLYSDGKKTQIYSGTLGTTGVLASEEQVARINTDPVIGTDFSLEITLDSYSERFQLLGFSIGGFYVSPVR